MDENPPPMKKFDPSTTNLSRSFEFIQLEQFGHNQICYLLIFINLNTNMMPFKARRKDSLQFLSNFNFTTKNVKRLAKYG